MERYKLAVQVIVGENKGQGVRVTSKSLWDPTVDNSATYTYLDVANFYQNKYLTDFRIKCLQLLWSLVDISNK